MSGWAKDNPEIYMRMGWEALVNLMAKRSPTIQRHRNEVVDILTDVAFPSLHAEKCLLDETMRGLMRLAETSLLYVNEVGNLEQDYWADQMEYMHVKKEMETNNE